MYCYTTGLQCGVPDGVAEENMLEGVMPLSLAGGETTVSKGTRFSHTRCFQSAPKAYAVHYLTPFL